MNTNKKLLALAIAAAFTPNAHADQVINDDLIVTQSECIGFDCINGESFGFDTLRLKENNVRIHFNDTSNSASFPSADWTLIANDTTNGGANYFAIQDRDNGTTPFRVLQGAGNNALYVDAQGDVGLNTSNPVVELHIADGDSPTLRLEQNGSSGFTPQTWDIAGNEANFFIRDVTNGSKLPFKIIPNAPSNSLYIAADGNIGIGTSSPDADFEISTSESYTYTRLTATGGGNTNTSVDTTFTGGADKTGEYRLNIVDGDNQELTLDADGNLTLTGEIYTTTCESPNPCAPDYVFAKDYSLKPLDELAAFIEKNKHLPSIPPATELVGPISMSSMQMKLLEKIEELTLYTIQQEKKIANLEARLILNDTQKTE